MKNIIVVGSGVIAESIIFWLNQHYTQGQAEITQISADDFYPACTESSTATIALRNTKKGLSPLGDLLYDGFWFFKDFFKTFKPAGVELVDHQIISTTEDQKFLKRYGQNPYKEQSYLISWQPYLKWMRQSHHIPIKRIKDFVIETKKNSAVLKDRAEVPFDEIFWCTNFNRTSKTKVRPGSYLELDYPVSKAQIFEVDGINILFREIDNKLLIGSTTLRDNHLISPVSGLRDIYIKSEKFLKESQQINLPEFSHFKIQTGMRSLGSRMPFFNRINECSWGLYDFHKNGYLLSQYVSHKVVTSHQS